LPSGPLVSAVTQPAAKEDSVPVGVIRSIESSELVNHRFPSGPAMMTPARKSSDGKHETLAVGIGNSVSVPEVVIRPMNPYSMNHRLPSGPVAIPSTNGGWANAKPVDDPDGVTRSMPLPSVTQRLPSGPAAIAAAGT